MMVVVVAMMPIWCHKSTSRCPNDGGLYVLLKDIRGTDLPVW